MKERELSFLNLKIFHSCEIKNFLFKANNPSERVPGIEEAYPVTVSN